MMLIIFSSIASAQIYSGSTGKQTTVNDLVTQAQDGHIIVMGEHHGFPPSYENQRRILNELSSRRARISVGLEFFERQYQSEVNKFVSGESLEKDFLSDIGWGNNIPFENYRYQARFSHYYAGKTLALNARRALTSKVAKSGLDSLSADERAELPENFQLGNDFYKERFREIMSGHAPDEMIDRYFAAQSIWDETMADTACRFITDHPEQVLMIIVGDFHAAYGGGLPDRIKARGCSQLTVVSQVEEASEIAPHPRWGSRGDFVWLNVE